VCSMLTKEAMIRSTINSIFVLIIAVGSGQSSVVNAGSCKIKFERAWAACDQKYNNKCKYLGKSFKPNCQWVVPQDFSANESIALYLNSPKDFKEPSRACESNVCKPLLKLINGATRTIDFSVYGLRGQDDLMKALHRAKSRNVKIRGVVDKDIDNKSYYSDTQLLETLSMEIKTDYESDQKKLRDMRSIRKGREKCARPADHLGPLQCFDGKGYASKEKISFRGDIMHNKFFIIDGRYVWTGSTNLSDTGTGGYNANLAVVLDSTYFAQRYQQELSLMLDGAYHKQKKADVKSYARKSIGDSNISLYFSPQDGAVYNGVLPAINAATKTIDLAIFFLTHNEISKALVKARHRGVAIRVILDATAASNGYSKHDYLRENGILVKVEDWGGKMHMKSAVIDGETLILGSMNWTSAGDKKNDENTLVIRDAAELAAEHKKFFNQLWGSIAEKWLYADPRPESLDSATACFDGIDNDFDRAVDEQDSDCSM